jgi:hypothetical protein
MAGRTRTRRFPSSGHGRAGLPAPAGLAACSGAMDSSGCYVRMILASFECTPSPVQIISVRYLQDLVNGDSSPVM